MRAVDRLVALLAAIFFLALAVGFVWGATGLEITPFSRILDYLSNTFWRIALSALILLFFSAYFFWMGLRRRRTEKTVLCETPLGEVRVAERAIEALALRATRKVKGVHDASINVRATPSGLDIFVESTVGPDQSIPQITQEIRTRVGDYIRETVGVSVNTVAVLITRIASEHKARVE